MVNGRLSEAEEERAEGDRRTCDPRCYAMAPGPLHYQGAAREGVEALLDQA